MNPFPEKRRKGYFIILGVRSQIKSRVHSEKHGTILANPAESSHDFDCHAHVEFIHIS